MVAKPTTIPTQSFTLMRISQGSPSSHWVPPGVDPVTESAMGHLIPTSTPDPELPRLQRRLEKRMESLQRVKLAGFEIVISELEVELDYLRRAMRYLEE